MSGFTYYDEIPSTSPTTQEILVALTSTQKLAVLNGFATETPITELKHSAGIHPYAIGHLYQKIDEIEERSRALMRGEVLISQDPDVYNTPPTTSAELLAEIQDDFSDDFTSAQVTAILTKMVNYSKHDGTGDWAYYASVVVL
jgi:hypothetical protein